MSIDTKIGKKYDHYKKLTVPYGCYFIVRLDGNCFSNYCRGFKRPFDERFYETMKNCGKYLIENISDIYKLHSHSDEISLYFNRDSKWFNRRVEKICSITAGMLSSRFTELSPLGLAHFDSRVLVTPTKRDVSRYEKDRRLNAFRGCINSTAYWNLREKGLSKKQATKKLLALKSDERQELLFSEFGINVAKLPSWQRVGLFLERQEYLKEGYNPIKKKKEKAVRHEILEIT